MIKLEHVVLASPEQMEFIIEGMRNPMNSWEKSDSYENYSVEYDDDLPGIEIHHPYYRVGATDLNLMQRLAKAGTEHRKYMRMIHAQVCITAPLYWWKEMDTYKVGTTANSTSTMHRIANYPITMDCFEMDDFDNYVTVTNNNFDQDCINFIWGDVIRICEELRQKYNETKDKKYWKELIRLLPESWLQTRMFDCDYATLRNIYCWRVKIPHKLTEWKQFGDWVETLPYAKELIIN